MYSIKFGAPVENDLGILKKSGKKIAKSFSKKIQQLQEKPKVYGKLLQAELSGYWSARFSDDYRIVYSIDEQKKIIYLVAVGHRSRIYPAAKKRTD